MEKINEVTSSFEGEFRFVIPVEILASGCVEWAVSYLRTELIGSGLKIHIYSVETESQLYTAFP